MDPVKAWILREMVDDMLTEIEFITGRPIIDRKIFSESFLEIAERHLEKHLEDGRPHQCQPDHALM